MAEFGCGKCESRRVIPKAKIVSCADRPDLGLTAVVARKPQAALFRGEVQTKLSARVCGECGYTEFFADEAGALFDAYVEAQRAVTVDSGA
jgi:hypothetical protein